MPLVLAGLQAAPNDCPVTSGLPVSPRRSSLSKETFGEGENIGEELTPSPKRGCAWPTAEKDVLAFAFTPEPLLLVFASSQRNPL